MRAGCPWLSAKAHLRLGAQQRSVHRPWRHRALCSGPKWQVRFHRSLNHWASAKRPREDRQNARDGAGQPRHRWRSNRRPGNRQGRPPLPSTSCSAMLFQSKISFGQTEASERMSPGRLLPPPGRKRFPRHLRTGPAKRRHEGEEGHEPMHAGIGNGKLQSVPLCSLTEGDHLLPASRWRRIHPRHQIGPIDGDLRCGIDRDGEDGLAIAIACERWPYVIRDPCPRAAGAKSLRYPFLAASPMNG